MKVKKTRKNQQMSLEKKSQSPTTKEENTLQALQDA
jgi:hypothetical protein